MSNQYLMNSSIANIYSLTPMQEGMLYFNIVDSASTSYVIQNVFEIEGTISEEAIIQALDLLSQRYDVLRTSIIYEQLSLPRQIVLRKRTPEYCKIQLHNTSRELNEEQMLSENKKDIERGFDLQKDKLFRVTVFDFSDGVWKMVWTYHHIIVDGWCLSLLYESFLGYYNSLMKGKTFEELENEVAKERKCYSDYGAYIQWVEQKDKKELMQYWKEVLDGYDEVTDINPIRKPEPVPEQVSSIEINLNEELSEKLVQLGTSNQSTISSVIESAWGVVLHKYTNVEDVVFGKVVSGRNADIRGIEHIVGLFINTIPSRIQFGKELTVNELIRQVQKQGVESNTYFYGALSDIQGMTKQKAELIKTLFVFENYDFNKNILEEESSYLKMKIEDAREKTTYGLNLVASKNQETLHLKIAYEPHKYYKKDIENILDNLSKVLLYFADNPEARIAELEMISNTEKIQILGEFNNTEVQYEKNMTIHEMFEKQVLRSPDAPAVLFGEQVLTYRELNEKANSLARVLIKLGVKKDSIIAVMAERSFEMMVGIFAILKAGGAYLPISPDFPEERKRYLLKDSGTKLLLYKGKLSIDLHEDIEALSLDKKELYENNVLNIDIYNPDGLAYIIYTSGSTGQPKGVMIEHHSVINRISWMQKKYPLTEQDVILQKTTYTFDVSVWELFWWCWYGAKLALLVPGGEKEPALIAEAIHKYQVTVMHFVPTMFNAFLESYEVKEEIGKAKSLKYIFTSGEALNIEHVNKFRNTIGQKWKTKLINLYGPTEATVDVSCYDCDCADDIVPIGKPIDNIKLFILDQEKHLQPVGFIGELAIAGAGLARGYLDREELTAQKFVENPYLPQERMYMTGDIARWLPDGNIEYLGRIDHQFKIRGIRIEIGEIENTIRSLDGIIDAAVIVREDENKNKSICAYYVGKESISASELKNMLKEQLPEYMVPALVMEIDKIPVTTNGKVDRAALPEIEKREDQSYVEPRNEMETVLCSTFQEVLGIERVGIRDSFFDLGGDSIRAIRIVSKMRTLGYKVSVKDIMNKYTVEAIAFSVTSLTKKKAEKEDEIVGRVVSTPIIRKFSEWNLQVPNHFNQDVIVKVDIQDEMKIRRILKALAVHHDMLRAVYRNRHLEVLSVKESHLYEFKSVDLRKEENVQQAMEEACTKVQQSIDLENGPLFKAVLFKLEGENKLFFCMHHLIVDSVSWRILLEDFAIALKQVQSGRKVALPEKTDSFIKWSKALKEYEHSKQLLKEKTYWDDICVQMKAAHLMLKEKQCADEEYSNVNIVVDKQKSSEFIYQSGKAFNTNAADLLLCAVGMAVRKVTGQDKISIELEGHGREEIDKKIDIDRTVGWFTTKYPVVLNCMDDIQEMIVQTKETIRKLPNNGIGYGVLEKQLTQEKVDILFNYLGIMEGDAKSGNVEYFSMGKHIADENLVFRGIAINAYVKNGEMNILITNCQSDFNEDEITRFRESYHFALNLIIQFCTAQKETIKTASDYSSMQLSDQDAASIQDYFSDSYKVQDIYALTPLQSGILFYYLLTPGTTEYINQSLIALRGQIDIILLRKAVQLLVLRFPALRTAIMNEGLSQPRQVVLENRTADFNLVDLSSLAEHEREQEITKIMQEDLNRGFDLQKDSLLRVTILKCSKDSYKMIWLHHHIILDGWCLAIVYGTLKHYYSELVQGITEERLAEIGREEGKQTEAYAEYVKWMEEKDKEDGIAYWNTLLEGYENVIDIKPMNKPKSGSHQVARIRETISPQQYQQIHQLAVENKVTENIVYEAAFGVLLQNYNLTEDVVFGKIVSGRNAEIRGIDNIVGLFINTIPIRVQSSSSMMVEELLETLKNQANESQKYDYCSLSEIQAMTPQKGNLIKVLFAYENYFIDMKQYKQNEESLQLDMDYSREQTNFGITLTMYKEDDKETIDILYNSNIFTEEEAQGIINKMKRILEQFLQNPKKKVEDIDIITESEKVQILYEFNNTYKEYDRTKTVIDMFEEAVESYPNQTAVVFENQKVSYGELNQKANQLANRLRKHSMKNGDAVAVMCRKSAELIIAVLGVMKAGGSYVPIDPTYPKQRIAYILEDCKPFAMLKYDVDVETDLLVIDLADKSLAEEEKTNFEKINTPEDITYIIYTSGTTGKPKGSLIKNKSIIRLVNEPNYVGLDENTVILQTGSIAFDALTFEIWGALLNGGTVVLAEKDVLTNAREVKKYITKYNVNTMFLTTALFNQIVSMEEGTFDRLTYLLIGGEKVSEEHVRMFKARKNGVRLSNIYGPTENTTFTTSYEIPDDYSDIPIGSPINNTQVYIMNGNRLCGVGVPGELCIAGEGLAKGYLNNRELTEKKFQENPFGDGKLYRSGDLVRWTQDGNVDFIGRIDSQVKIRGFRVELAEIEAALREMKEIEDSCVIATKNNQDNSVLYVYYVEAKPCKREDMIKHLKSKLPEYMIPVGFVSLSQIPLTKSGKIDKSRLPAPTEEQVRGTHRIEEARNECEKEIQRIWKEILGLEIVSIQDNFFEIGGNSLLVMKMVSKIKTSYPDSVKVGDVFANPTIADLAEFIQSQEDTELCCCQIEFPEEYFSESDRELEQNYSFDCEDETFKNIQELWKKDKQKIESFLLFIFASLINDKTNNHEFDICVGAEQKFSSIKINMENDDLNILMQKVKEQYRLAEKLQNYKFHIESVEKGVLPLLLINTEITARQNDFFDFILNCTIEEQVFQVKLDINNRKLNRNLIYDLYSNYILIMKELF